MAGIQKSFAPSLRRDPMIKKYMNVACFLLANFLCPQQALSQATDSLAEKDYDYIFDKIEDSKTDSILRSRYLKYFLTKARSENNFEEQVDAYKNYLHHSAENLKIAYADSMIYAARRSGDSALVGAAHLSKGVAFYGMKKHAQALDQYLVAGRFISTSNDRYLVYKVKYHIGLVKHYLGYYGEAILLFKECIAYFKNEDSRAYLNSLHSLGLCYNKIGNYGLCSATNNTGLREGGRLENHDMDAYFRHSEGINQYSRSNYSAAILGISQSLPSIARDKDFANITVGYFYIGKSYWNINNKEKALAYFREVDRKIDEHGYIRPDLRENYEMLIRYHKSKNNLKMQLYYIEKLMKADSILHDTFRYLSDRMHKDYDAGKLIQEKKIVEERLKNRSRNDALLIATIIVLFLALLYLSYRYIIIRKQYLKSFEELMNMRHATPAIGKNIDPSSLGINREAVAGILKHLEKFEKEKKFLAKDVTLAKLAVAFNTNTKYISQVIYSSREKKFAEYVNGLRIDYIVSALQQDRMLRNYTNKALAEEAGFSSTERFAKAFLANTGMPATFFIQQLKKEIRDLATESAE